MNIIYRHGQPNKFDIAPYATVCIIKHARDFDVYLQSGKGDQTSWESLGNFFNEVDMHSIQSIIEKRLYSDTI